MIMNTQKEKIKIIVHMTVLLIIGAFVYYLFFPDVFFVRIMDKAVPINFHLSSNKQDSCIFRFFRFYFFDFLWAYTFAGILIVFANNAKPSKSCVFIPIVVGLVLEIMQWLQITSGTGDFFDVLVECAGAAAATLLIYKRRTLYEEK